MAAREPAVGIDLGTAFSAAAYLDDDGKPISLRNAEGDLTTPSVVLFDRHGVVVGKEAVKAAAIEPQRVASFAKRNMGEDAYERSLLGQSVPPEVVQALVLQKIKNDAAQIVGAFTKAVVTVPAYFNEPRRKATQDAGRLAGLDVIDIINEPTAAAVAFGVQRGFLGRQGEAAKNETLMVYDLGGGTFDVTVMSIEGSRYEALATAGDVYLGGLDFDRRLADYVCDAFAEQHGVDLREDPAAFQLVLLECEALKRALSAREEVSFSLRWDGAALRLPIARSTFEELTADLLERTRFTSNRVLKDAGLKWSDLTRVLLVGGSTRMPMVARMLAAESGRPPDASISPDEAVAQGAAIYAGMLLDLDSGAPPRVSVSNVNSHDLGVLGIETETGRPRKKVLIPRNSPLPATRRGHFVTHRADQRTVAVPVIEGGDASGHNATPIGKCVVEDLPPELPKGTPVEVSFTYSRDGRMTVTARLPATGKAATLTIQRAAGLSEECLAKWEQRIASGSVLDEPDADEPDADDPDAEEPATDERATDEPADAGEVRDAQSRDRLDPLRDRASESRKRTAQTPAPSSAGEPSAASSPAAPGAKRVNGGSHASAAPSLGPDPKARTSSRSDVSANTAPKSTPRSGAAQPKVSSVSLRSSESPASEKVGRPVRNAVAVPVVAKPPEDSDSGEDVLRADFAKMMESDENSAVWNSRPHESSNVFPKGATPAEPPSEVSEADLDFLNPAAEADSDVNGEDDTLNDFFQQFR